MTMTETKNISMTNALSVSMAPPLIVDDRMAAFAYQFKIRYLIGATITKRNLVVNLSAIPCRYPALAVMVSTQPVTPITSSLLYADHDLSIASIDRIIVVLSRLIPSQIVTAPKHLI